MHLTSAMALGRPGDYEGRLSSGQKVNVIGAGNRIAGYNSARVWLQIRENFLNPCPCLLFHPPRMYLEGGGWLPLPSSLAPHLQNSFARNTNGKFVTLWIHPYLTTLVTFWHFPGRSNKIIALSIIIILQITFELKKADKHTLHQHVSCVKAHWNINMRFDVDILFCVELKLCPIQIIAGYGTW